MTVGSMIKLALLHKKTLSDFTIVCETGLFTPASRPAPLQRTRCLDAAEATAFISAEGGAVLCAPISSKCQHSKTGTRKVAHMIDF